MEGVEDVELHVVEGLEKGSDEFSFELEEFGEFVFEEVVVVVEFLGGELDVVFGFVEGFFVFEGFVLFVLEFFEGGVSPVEVELFVGTFKARLLDDFENA